MLREPLFHFIVAGALLFVFAQWLGGSREEPQVVTVDRSDLERLTEQWEAQYGLPPTPEQTSAILRNHIRDEILYREALKLGLDRDDVIVRRRLVQKFRFVTEGLSELAEPSEDELRQFYRSRPQQYAKPAETSFQHVYFSSEQRGENARRDAEAALQELKSSPDDGVDWRGLGDPSILQREYGRRPERELTELFGTQFVEKLSEIEPGTWSEPIASLYGWHVVRVRDRTPGRLPEFSTIRGEVEADWLTQRRKEANESLYRTLRENYEIELLDIPEPDLPGAAPASNP